MAGKRLNAKQLTFVREYLVDLNGTQAAIRAGYSPLTANEQAAQLLAKLSIKRAVQEGMKVRAARLDLSADKVVRELMLVAFSNVADYQVTDLGNLKVRQSADRGAIRAVSSFKRKVKTIVGEKGSPGSLAEVESEVKLWDKVSALKTLAHHLGIVTPVALPPLEQILALLPADEADGVRRYLAEALSRKSNSGGDGDAPG